MTRANDLSGIAYIKNHVDLDFIAVDAIVEHEPVFRERSRINLDDMKRKRAERVLENKAMILINVLENRRTRRLARKKVKWECKIQNDRWMFVLKQKRLISEVVRTRDDEANVPKRK
jgi:hypothetical protein